MKTEAPDFDQMFEQFDAENPGVYELFKRFAIELWASGRRRMSAAMIVERIRWETAIKTTGDSFKVNDIFTARYARKLVDELPKFKDAFEFRKTGHRSVAA